MPDKNPPSAVKESSTPYVLGGGATLYSDPAQKNKLSYFLLEKDFSKAVNYWFGEICGTSTPKSVAHTVALLTREIARIDDLLIDQINAILHHKKFQRLEASWRGLWYLVEQSKNAKLVKIRVLDLSWNELSRDIDRAIEFDQSQLFQKIYSDEYGTPGGEPFGLLLGDYQITHRPNPSHRHDDIPTLEGMALIAAASFAPFITSASPAMFGLDDFSGLGMPMNLEKTFNTEEYIRWRAFRDKPDSRFVGLTLPHMLMRLPHRTRLGSQKGLMFVEKTAGPDASKYLWGNPAYAFAAILAREFSSVGWFGHIRGVPRGHLGGGLVTTLPTSDFETDSPGVAIRYSTDVLISDAIERIISDLGFIPLCQCYDTPYAAFYSNQSVQKPKWMDSKEANINAKLSSMLQHILCGSRIAHYIKVIMRDKVGSFISAQECERYLEKWLIRYTSSREDLEWSEQARYPLRDATARVRDVPGRPGQYSCAIHLKPHYQLDNLVSELELITELAPV